MQLEYLSVFQTIKKSIFMQHPLQGPPQQRIVKMTLRWRTQTQLRQFFLFVIVVAVLSCLLSLSLSFRTCAYSACTCAFWLVLAQNIDSPPSCDP